jgi:hypothetical protein
MHATVTLFHESHDHAGDTSCSTSPLRSAMVSFKGALQASDVL